ncbi:MAG: FeoB small GTPase domain-containing protein [bacterium JZ-2024 1]
MSSPCESCPVLIQRSGVSLTKYDYLLALAGNPNTGKSTLFNALTGLKQHIGNWPGKTVMRAEGGFRFQGETYKVVDLPGTYSLLSASVEEEIARDFILFGNPDCVIVIMDATAVERNLNLTLQILEMTDRVVVALNLMDEAKRKGVSVDAQMLAEELGVPVVPTVARTGEGIGYLIPAAHDVIKGVVRTRPRRIPLDADIEEAVTQLAGKLEAEFGTLPNARWLALRLLDGDPSLRSALQERLLKSGRAQTEPVERHANGVREHTEMGTMASERRKSL